MSIVYRPTWLLKPTHACNLNCKYCYDKDMRHKYGDMVMPMAIFEKVLRLASSYGAHIIIHGGEPLMTGLEWYKEAFAIIKRYQNNRLSLSLQTNGFLLNEEFIQLFLNNGLKHIGMSYDFAAQAEMRDKVDISAIMRMKNALNFKIGIICVVSKSNVDKLIEMYDEAEALTCDGLSFNPLFLTQSTIEHGLEMLTMDELRQGFGSFFKYYHQTAPTRLRERTADSYLGMAKGIGSRVCSFVDCRCTYVGVSPNGDIHPCDRYFGDEYVYGNVSDFSNISELVHTDGFSKYYRDVQIRYQRHCSQCQYVCFCQGGCNGTHGSIGSVKNINNKVCDQFHSLYMVAKEVLWNDGIAFGS